MKCPKCNTENAAKAHFCHSCGANLGGDIMPKGIDEVDRKILEVIKENSYSRRILAAYEARKYANLIAKKSFGKEKKNYREYVEMLMKLHYPQELEKSILGKKYLIWVIITVVLSLSLFGIVLSVPIIIWFIIPTYKKLKSMCV